jgi:ribosomal protein S18 acetylase RimI-like enzyme
MAELRLMRPQDIPAGLELCRLAGWNQLDADWRRLLELEPQGLFVADESGRVAGTASTTSYDRRTAWIGMVLVHPDFRRQGLGSALMTRCIETLRARGIQSIKLDATDQGRPVYLKLGFRDERPICRYAGKVPGGVVASPLVRPLQPGDWPAVVALDEEAFGADRRRLLELLARDGQAVVAAEGSRVRGYGFVRDGHLAAQIGPVVAADEAAAEAVARALLTGKTGRPLFWDVLPDNAGAARMAESLGLTVVRRLTRMVLGDTMNSGAVDRVYGAAGFELG